MLPQRANVSVSNYTLDPDGQWLSRTFVRDLTHRKNWYVLSDAWGDYLHFVGQQ